MPWPGRGVDLRAREPKVAPLRAVAAGRRLGTAGGTYRGSPIGRVRHPADRLFRTFAGPGTGPHMTAASVPPASLDELPPTAVRLRLKQPSHHPGMVNGAWWPRSRDLERELPALVAALDPVWGRIYHVTVQVGMWPEIPRKIAAGEHVVGVGWFGAEQDPNDICLISLRGGARWDLLVVPPELDAETAERLMVNATTVGNLQTASALLAAAQADPTGQRSDPGRIADWESEGGPTRQSA